MEPFIAKDRTIIPNLDMPQTKGIKRILERTAPLDEIGAYHLGSEIFEGNTVPQVVGLVREYTKKPIIYDALPHQIDDDREAERIVKYLRNEGIQAVTIFPLAGRDVMERWIQKSRDYGLEVIIGGHPSTYSSWEGSYLGREGIRRLYADACLLGATHFIVPATQPTFKPIIENIQERLLHNGQEPVFFSADYFEESKSGMENIHTEEREGAYIPGKRFHTIIGSALHTPLNIQKAASELYSLIANHKG